MSEPDLEFRHPSEADHAALIGLLDDWWGGERHIHELLPRLWFQHFTGTSWIADAPDGRPAGFLVGFVSPDDPSVAYIHMVGTSPNHRRRGVGTALYGRFFDEMAARGVARVRAVTWPGNRVSVNFHRALGFLQVDGPGSQNIYGMTAFPDYDYPGGDRVVFERALEERSPGYRPNG